MIKEWLEEYQPKNREEEEQALREIMQEIALAGLQRSGFFEEAAFYGGTALRIFHGLERFSEDLDFSLLKDDPQFSLESYLESIITEFKALGMSVSVKEKIKVKKGNIDSAFLKSDTIWNELTLLGIVPQEGMGIRPSIKIKLEVDTKPPLGFETEEKLLVRPFSFYVKCFALPDLFAGKMHALLFRQWAKRVKGRDWYDMEWYIKKGVPVNLSHFGIRAQNSGNWKSAIITEAEFKQLLERKIEEVSIDDVREDIKRFIKDESSLTIWSVSYFKDLIQKIRFKS
jgi:predicted nucleotidyltransferase component of viral defense system